MCCVIMTFMTVTYAVVDCLKEKLHTKYSIVESVGNNFFTIMNDNIPFMCMIYRKGNNMVLWRDETREKACFDIANPRLIELLIERLEGWSKKVTTND